MTQKYIYFSKVLRSLIKNVITSSETHCPSMVNVLPEFGLQ